MTKHDADESIITKMQNADISAATQLIWKQWNNIPLNTLKKTERKKGKNTGNSISFVQTHKHPSNIRPEMTGLTKF